RSAARRRARDERPTPGRPPRGRPVDRGSTDRRGDPARVCPRRGGGRVIKRYAALIRNAWLVDLQYRASIVLWLLWGVTEPAIALGIWWAIAGDGSVAGYARADFARYFFAVMLINQLTIAWDSWYLDRWIREGDLNYRLARPLHPAHEAVAENIAYKARTASVILVVWLLVAAAWPAVRLSFDPGRWAITAVAVQGTDAILQGLGGQIVWLAVWILAYRVAWSRGIRKYGAVGG